MIFHFESSPCFSNICKKMNEGLVGWRDVARRNRITAILSKHAIAIINCYVVITEIILFCYNSLVTEKKKITLPAFLRITSKLYIKMKKIHCNEISKGKLNEPCAVNEISITLRKSWWCDYAVRLIKDHITFCSGKKISIRFSEHINL